MNLAGARWAEQQRGHPLFRADYQAIASPRRCYGEIAGQRRFRLMLDELTAPNDEPIGEALVEANRQGLENVVRDNRFVLEEYYLIFAFYSKSFQHLWARSPMIPLTDWLCGGQRTREWMEQLANGLNSSDVMDIPQDEFYVELLFFKKSGRGSGGRGKKGNPGRMTWEKMAKKKKCVLQINSKDDLCCARAIVTMKAREDNDPQYNVLKRGRPFQKELAKKLHQDACVPECPCGQEELQQFQAYLGPEYHLIVVEPSKGLIVFKERAYDSAPKMISLVKSENHYDGLTSIPSLLNRSYFCHHCEKGYSTDDAKHHNCQGQHCPACRRAKNGNEPGCPNYAKWVTPERECERCHIRFYGPECFEAYHAKKKRTEKCP